MAGDFSFDEYRIYDVGEVGPVQLEGIGPATEERRHPPYQQPRRQRDEHREEARDHFEELSSAAAAAHRRLVRDGVPYRFCVYRQGDRVIVDIVELDAEGNVASVVVRDITHQDFFQALEHMSQGEGLILDSLV